MTSKIRTLPSAAAARQEGLLSLSEVCRQTGATRRAMQEYHKIGLFSPSAVAGSGGYWYYEPTAVTIVNGMLALADLGYSRKDIRRVMTMDQAQLKKELQCARRRLEIRRRRLEVTERQLKLLEHATALPLEDILEAERYGREHATGDFKSFLKEFRKDLEEDVEYREYLASMTAVSGATFGLMRTVRESSGDAAALNRAAARLYDTVRAFMDEAFGEDLREFEEDEMEELMEEVIRSLLEEDAEPAMQEVMEQYMKARKMKPDP